MQRNDFPRRLLLGALLAVLFTAPSGVRAEGAHAEFREFFPTGEFDLYVDAAQTDAEVLFSRRAAAYLVLPSGGDDVFLLLQRKQSVFTAQGQLLRRTNGDVDLPDDAVLEPVGRFEAKDGKIQIDAKSLQARLVPRPPLIGSHGGDAVRAHAPQYGLVSRAFRPDKDAVTKLKAASKVRVEALFGSWCPRCQQAVGNALRVEQEIAGNGVTFAYYGLPRPPDAWKDKHWLESQAKALPTALVFVDDKLAGRIGPADWTRFDVALAKLLK